MHFTTNFLFLNVFLMFLFTFERERERDRDRASGGGAERARETQNPKQTPGSQLSAQSRMQGLNSRAVRS